MRLEVLKSGVGPKDYADHEAITKLIKAALPHQAEFIDEYGPTGYHYLLDEIETKLLRELQEMLAGTEADQASIEKAAEVVKLATAAVKNAEVDAARLMSPSA